jgi:hypothetical protein
MITQLEQLLEIIEYCNALGLGRELEIYMSS